MFLSVKTAFVSARNTLRSLTLKEVSEEQDHQGWDSMAVMDKSNGAKAKHRGRLGKDGPVRALGQSAAVAGTSGVLLLALKAAVLVSPTVLPHAAGAGLNALGIPNSLSAIAGNTGALAGAGDDPVIFRPASTATEVGDTDPINRPGREDDEFTAPAEGGNSSNPTDGTGTTPGDSTGGDDDEDSDDDNTGGDPTTPTTPTTPTAPAEGVVGGLVDSLEKAVPAITPVTGALQPVTTAVGGAADTLLNPVKSVPIVGPTLTGVTDGRGHTDTDDDSDSDSDSEEDDPRGGSVGGVTGVVGGLTSGLGLGLGG